MEEKVILINFIKNFKFEVSQGFLPKEAMSVTWRSLNGMELKVMNIN